MTIYPRLLCALGFILFTSHLCCGQPAPASPPAPTTFEELRALLMSTSPERQAAEARIQQAEARLAGSRLPPNPELSYERSTDLVFGHEGEGGHSVSFTLPWELGGKRQKRIRVAETEVEIARAELRDVERQLTGRLRLLYARTIAASSRSQVAEKLVRENEGLERIMDVRVRSGDASKLESTLVAAETRRLRLQAMRASGEETNRLIELRSLAGLNPSAPLALGVEPEFARTTSPELESAIAEAFRLRPDLEAARLREEAAQRSILVNQAGRIPNLNPFLGFSRDTNVLERLLPGGLPFVDRGNELVFGVSLDLPVWSQHRAKVAEAVSTRQQARHDREARERKIRLEIESTLQRVTSSQAAANLASTDLLSEQRESVRILQLSYELGETGLADLLTQRRLLIETDLTLVDLREELWLALAELETALGR
jgi:cobalt-zinc-cadmium efflux system outer membrane protein